MPEATKTQADQRLTMNGEDRFKRPFLYNRETHTKHGGVCGHITPAGWEFPKSYVVEQKYLSVPANRPYTVVIDFESIIRDNAAAETAWQDRVDHIIDTLPRFATVDPAKPTDAVMRLAGPKPVPTENWRKAKAGNWKYLTASGKKPPALVFDDDDEPQEPIEESADEAGEDAGVVVGSRGGR